MRGSASDLLKSAGLRCTPTQIAVLERLAWQNSPVTHRELAEELSLMGHEPSTVFRCLQRLVENGLAVQFDLGDHVHRYELSEPTDEQTGRHHPHFLCVKCGDVLCHPPEKLPLPTDLHEFHPQICEIMRVVLTGRCKGCALVERTENRK